MLENPKLKKEKRGKFTPLNKTTSIGQSHHQIRSKSSDFANFDIWVDSPDYEGSRDPKILS